MRRETGLTMLLEPFRGDANPRAVEIRRNRIQRERSPVTRQNHRQRNPLIAHWPKAEQEQEAVAEADLCERVLEGPVSLRAAGRTEKDT